MDHFTLKRSYSSSLVIREDHRLVTIMGAPAYASSGYGALVLSALVPLVLLRVQIEEEFLIEQFGDEYRARTKRLIPFLDRGASCPSRLLAAEQSP